MSGAVRAFFLTGLLCLAVHWTLGLFDGGEAGRGLLFQIVSVALPMGVGLLVYLIPARLVCPSEFRCILDAFSGKAGGSEKERRG